MRIGPELKTVSFQKPAHVALTVYVPEVVVARDGYYGDLDFTISAQTVLTVSSYEYGYIFKIVLLGFGFEVWFARNI